VNRAGLLAAAAVLREFTPAQLAAWCEEDVDTVAAFLAAAGDLFGRLPTCGRAGPDGPRWRVNDAQVLHQALLEESRAHRREWTDRVRPAEGRGSAGRPSWGLDARLRMAEETLMDCAEEPSALGRRLMADSAMNYLRQFLADVLPQSRPWWEIEPALVATMPAQVPTGAGTVTRSRLRADLALARLTSSAATGVPVEAEFLLRTARGLDHPFGSSDVDEEWLSRLTGRFTELALALVRPSVHDIHNMAAPARLLSALTWRHALTDAHGNVREAVRGLAQALQAVVRTLPEAVPDDGPTSLYQVLASLPQGRKRINVYAGLLAILPRQLGYHEEEQVVPGVLVTAVTGPRASHRLRMYADTIEEDLVHSDFTSGSALLGQAAHLVQDLAERGASMDGSVLERSDRTRRHLLALAGVPV
jgi:hypothetical protein